jgi:hypothetical protein
MKVAKADDSRRKATVMRSRDRAVLRGKDGGPQEDRTPDLRVANPVLQARFRRRFAALLTTASGLGVAAAGGAWPTLSTAACISAVIVSW